MRVSKVPFKRSKKLKTTLASSPRSRLAKKRTPKTKKKKRKKMLKKRPLERKCK